MADIMVDSEFRRKQKDGSYKIYHPVTKAKNVKTKDGSDLESHLAESASDAHGEIRKEYILFKGALVSGNVTLTLPNGFTSLDDFDEIIVIGTLNRPGISGGVSSGRSEILLPKNVPNIHSLSWNYEILYAGLTVTDTYYLLATINKTLKTLNISYNRKKIASNNSEDTDDNAFSSVIGVKYK